VRTDERVEADLQAAGMEKERWSGQARRDWMRRGGGEISLSISGFERNRLFLSLQGRQFEDLSGVSGLDALADGRAFALLDYDRDGWQDIAVVNVNAPLLSLYRNDIGLGDSGSARVIALRLVGGNHAPESSNRYGPRDGYGAVVTAYVQDAAPIVREHRCGEGLAAQNSTTLLIGIGERDAVDSLTVRWPGGTVQRTGEVAAKTLLTVYENPDHSPGGDAFASQPYAPAPASRWRDRLAADADSAQSILAAFEADGTSFSETAPGLRMYTSTATWCASCKASLPQLSLLREAFEAERLDMSGVPIDPADSAEKLEAYLARYRPAYRLRTDWSAEQIAAFGEILARETGLDALPSTLITDNGGRLLLAMTGVPTVSHVRRLLATDRQRPPVPR